VRALVVWAVLFAAYAATLGVGAVGREDYAADEPRYLLAAESIVSDGDIDLADEFATRAYAPFHHAPLRPQGRVVLGRRLEPQGVGFAALIAPAYLIGGPDGVELFLAAVSALAFVLGARLARRIVPEPWASGAALLVGLSPPALSQATTVYPELVAGAMLAGAVLAALRVRERPDLRAAVVGAALLALLPWLGPKYLLPAAVVAVPLVRWTARRGRRTAALAAAEIMLASLVVYVTIDDRLYGGLTPSSAAASGRPPTGADSFGDYVSRTPRLASLWIDRDVGLLRWAPILALAVFAAWLLWRSRRLGVARAVPERADAEAAAGLSLLVCGAVVLVAAFAAPTLAGDWFPARHLVAAFPVASALVAWGLRHAPRTGGVLGALTLLGSAWLAAAFAFGGADGWVHPGVDAPYGPLVALLPRSGVGSTWFAVVAVALAGALVGVVTREWWRGRRPLAVR
jgi:hypothetical protein